MHTKPDLRVVLKWTIAGSGSVIAAVLPIAYAELASNIDPFHLGVHCVCRGHDRVHDEVPQHHIDA